MDQDISGEEMAQNLIPAVEEQSSSAETAFVKTHLDRLIAEGETEHEAKLMIALCLGDEIESMQSEGRSFDIKRYERLLEFLPILPE